MTRYCVGSPRLARFSSKVRRLSDSHRMEFATIFGPQHNQSGHSGVVDTIESKQDHSRTRCTFADGLCVREIYM
ncbi:hypothetical protein BD309DRAFT_766258 [Dichomitus squalens]|nr:hypothetical protein BD309DRAFT_766258 [Dichomitus squalens]